MTYKGYRDFYILYGGPETAKSLLSLPMIDDHVASESYYSEKDRTDWKPEFSTLEISALAALIPKTANGLAVKKKIGVIGSRQIVVERLMLDWVELADWDNDGDVDLLVNLRKHRWPTFKMVPHSGDGKTRYWRCPPKSWALRWLPNKGTPGTSDLGEPQLLFEAPDYKQFGAFTVSELDGDGTPEIVAAMGSVPRNSKQWLASEHRFFVLGSKKRLARQAVD